MGFFDDLGKGLNKVGKKTSEMASLAKLKLEITKNKSAIDKKYEELGSRIYFLNKEGIQSDESVETFFTEIDELFEAIKQVEVEIEELTNEEQGNTFACPSCGAKLKEGTKFCGSCGAKIEDVKKEVPVATETESKLCPNCGAEVGDAKFCNSCGTNIE